MIFVRLPLSLCGVSAGNEPVLCNRPRPAPVRRMRLSLRGFLDSGRKDASMESRQGARLPSLSSLSAVGTVQGGSVPKAVDLATSVRSNSSEGPLIGF